MQPQIVSEIYKENAITGAAGAAKPRLGAGNALGLVSFTTSQTDDVGPAFRSSDFVVVNQKTGRLTRMSTSVRTTARLHCEAFGNDRNKFKCLMVTTTYKPEVSWAPHHISDMLTAARMWCTRKNIVFRYAWVAELTQKGVMHYHVLVWVPKWVWFPKADEQGWWSHGHTETKPVYAPVKYAIKYTSKGQGDLHRFPVGARLFGTGGLNEKERNERMWWSMPKDIREQTTPDDRPRRNVGGGFILKRCGRIIESAWLFVCAGKGYVTIRRKTVEDLPTQFRPLPPWFSCVNPFPTSRNAGLVSFDDLDLIHPNWAWGF